MDVSQTQKRSSYGMNKKLRKLVADLTLDKEAL
jgi:hypothetical protein